MIQRFALACSLTLLYAAAAFAQSAQSIIGLVEDTTGAVLVGAKVTMKNTGTGISSVTMSNSAGLYNFTLVQVGNYDLTVESEGFKSETIRNIRVETGAQVRQNFKLEVGAVAEKVEVPAMSQDTTPSRLNMDKMEQMFERDTLAFTGNRAMRGRMQNGLSR